jgi:hypothetical protein
LDRFVDFKSRVAFEVLPNGSFRVITGTPWTIWEHLFGHILYHGIEHHAVTSLGCEWGISPQLRQYMVMRMVAV